MAYLLASTSIRAPHSIKEENNVQYAQVRTLNGTISRDYFGDRKRRWILDYQNVNNTDRGAIFFLYAVSQTLNAPLSWQISETNYVVNQTTVHVDFNSRDMNIRGESYISDFTLVLTEV